MALKEGSAAPDFRLRDAEEKVHRLSQYRGQKVVLYFYPKDNTPGCTVEAEEFNKSLKKIGEKGAVVLGVSPDDAASHQKFCEKLSLRFPLLSDPDGKVAARYGAYGEKTLYGRTFHGVYRTTYIIDEKGRVSKVFENVKVEGHSAEVLKAL
ncbi:MAG: thioredoxin-dependent thiol peroxidase [Candidatus Tectomicrobia bacterium]|nr:thioredoxin-dependent thiol peroxidase [Candidatus Tectomicrobia bacterium]